MAEGILLFAGDNVWSQELDRKKKYWIHGILLFLGTVALTAGIALEIHSKGNRAHFTSKHGLTGTSTSVPILINYRQSLSVRVFAARKKFLVH